MYSNYILPVVINLWDCGAIKKDLSSAWMLWDIVMTVIAYVTLPLISYAEVEITWQVTSITEWPLLRCSSPKQPTNCVDKYVFLSGVSNLCCEAS